MISKLYIENFRSIRKAEVPLGKITVLTGANNSGKSSLLYGLMVLQDFIRRPNQSLAEFFALPFINLGDFEEVFFKDKNPMYRGVWQDGFIRLGIDTSPSSGQEAEKIHYQLALGNGRTFIDAASQEYLKFMTSLSIGLPYFANTYRDVAIEDMRSNEVRSVKWNGIEAISETADNKERLMWLNAPLTAMMATDFVAVQRGFTKPYYVLVPLSDIIQTEDEIATWLKLQSQEHGLTALNHYLTDIAERKIELPSNGAPGLFRISSIHAHTGLQTNIVNEGTGTNQLVTILAKVFQPNKKFICIDEPEIHLHPSMVRKLAAAFCDIAEKEGKQFLISTHSEHFVQALMNQVAEGKMSPDDVKVYYLERQGAETTIEAQPINEKGQIAGGLSHFYESELADLQSFFKLVD